MFWSRLTPQALYYVEKDFLKRKLVVIEEREGSDAADYSIRALQSKHKLVQAVPIKDPATGTIRTCTMEVEGLGRLHRDDDAAVDQPRERLALLRAVPR